MKTAAQDRIESAIETINRTCDTIAGFRKKSSGGVALVESLGKLVKKPTTADYNQYTDTEVHAELCYAEVLLLQAVLTACEDENLVSFIKAGLKIRSCFQSFRYMRQNIQVLCLANEIVFENTC